MSLALYVNVISIIVEDRLFIKVGLLPSRLRWAASGGGGGSGFQLMLGNASVMVKPMPASEASKVEIGNVGDKGDATDVGNEVDGTCVGHEVLLVPAKRMPTRP